MNQLIITASLLFIIFSTQNQISAQQATSPKSEIIENVKIDPSQNASKGAQYGAFGEIITKKPVKKGNQSDAIYKMAKPIASDFTGYFVQVLTNTQPLEISSQLLTSFGTVYLEQLPNEFAYLLGPFSTTKSAANYKKNIIGNRYPNAKVIGYKNGKRMK